MLRFTLAVQMAMGAVLGYWASSRGCGSVGVLLASTLAACAMPVLTAILADVGGALVSRAQEPTGPWWRALRGEACVSIKIFALRQPWTFARPRVLPAVGSQTAIPVLLVHGFVCTHRLWDDMAPALRAQGHAVMAINLEPVFASIHAYAPLLEQAVEDLCRQSGQS
jgi:hypothetical protein